MDANYRFLYVDVGCNGRVSDGGVFRNSSLNIAFERNSLNIPPPELLTQQSFPLPYMLVADDAFPLKPFIQKPFSQIGLTTEKRIFNNRLSRARCIVKNSFGILANRFLVFMNPIDLIPEKVETILLTCCSLHNYLCSRAHSRSAYIPPGSCDSEDTAIHAVIPCEWR